MYWEDYNKGGGFYWYQWGSQTHWEDYKNEEVEKSTEKLEDTKKAVVTIRRKDSDKFEGQYKGSTGWFNLDHEFLKM